MSSRWLAGSSLVVLGIMSGCGAEPRPVTPPSGGSGGVSGTPPDGGTGGNLGPANVARPLRGSPHFAAIGLIAVSRHGTAALSLDAQGELRLWPALDGSVAPQAVALTGVTALQIQDAGDVILAGFAEDNGGGHLVRFDRRGARQHVADVRGPGTVLQVTPLVDADGAVRSTLTRRGTRFRALEAVGDADALVLVRRSEGDGEVTHAVARLTTTGGKLALGAEVALPVIPSEPTRFAATADGARVAFVRNPDDAQATPKVRAAAGAPAMPRPGRDRKAEVAADMPARPTAAPARIAIVDVARGADVTPAELRTQLYTAVAALGFSSPTRLHVFDQAAQADVDLAAGVVLAGGLARGGGVAIATGLLVGAFDVALVTQVPGGDTRYLGWQSNVPQRGALSPDGTRAAWATMRGELMIEHLDGSGELFAGLFEAPVSFVAFLGDDHVVLGSGRGTLHIVDARTGAETGSMVPPGPLGNVEVDPTTGWLAALRPGGGAWLVKLSPDAALPATTLAIADGAQQLALLAGGGADAPLLLTADGKNEVRRYTEAELRAGVSAKAIRERPVVKLPRAMTRFDHQGRGYVVESRRLLTFDTDGKQLLALDLAFDINDVTVSRDGAGTILVAGPTTVARLERDGAVAWTATVGPGGRWGWGFSGDGRRATVVGASGGLVVDAATGARVSASCAWRFGITAAPPLARAIGVAPICR